LVREEVKIAADTNVLVRAVMRDDAAQARAASKALTHAELIAIALPCLCEFVWVLRKVYSVNVEDIAAAIRALLGAANVQVNRPAVDAGLAMLEANGDFADGVIAYEGTWLGAETFVSFDKQAVTLLSKFGQPAQLL
jgi:predicted nucleic-acid-binding protein